MSLARPRSRDARPAQAAPRRSSRFVPKINDFLTRVPAFAGMTSVTSAFARHVAARLCRLKRRLLSRLALDRERGRRG